MPARAPKDPHAPKKYQSSYFLFSNERRAPLQADHKDKKITEISKVISAEWKVLSTERRTHYDLKSKEQKEKYLVQLEEYKQTDNYKEHQIKVDKWKSDQAEKGESTSNRKVAARKKGGTKAGSKRNAIPKKPKKPEAMPKRPQSSYFIYSNERRPQLREVYTDKKVTELSGLISKEWREKSDQEKKVYEAAAAVNKERYHTEMASYKKKEEYSQWMDDMEQWKKDKKRAEKMDVDSDDDSSDEAPSYQEIKAPKKPKDATCPKRPLTSYFIFAKEKREETKKQFPEKPITEIAKEISKKWNVLSDAEKKPYNEQAAVLKAKYNETLAEYKKSENAKAFEETMSQWKEKCADVKTRNKERRSAAIAKKRKSPKKSSPKKSKNAKKKQATKKKRYESDSDDESMTSGSESDSGSGSSGSSSSSGSGSYSGSGSDSDSGSGSSSGSSD